MEHNSFNRGLRIQPIPPPVEFPFPGYSNGLSRSPATTAPTSNTSPDKIARGLPIDQNPHPPPKSVEPTKPRLDKEDVPKDDSGSPNKHAMREGHSHLADPPVLLDRATTTIPPNGRETRLSQRFPPRSGLQNKTKTRPKQDKNTEKATQGSDTDTYRKFSVGNENYKTKGKVDKASGRLDISVNETANRGYLAKALGASLHHHLNPRRGQDGEAHGPQRASTHENGLRRPDLATKISTSLHVPAVGKTLSIPVLNIVIMVIGSRGDIQPFLKLGKLLKEDYGHNVRIASHPAFKKFVEEDTGLSFFSVGGDPSELMAFMVKNPGLIPSMSTIKAGEIGRRREAMFEMFQGFWRACINATDDETK